MKLVVGLGNPGKEYDKTRHNIGFMVLDDYLGNVKWSNKFNALYYESVINQEKVLFIKPLTYMNNSGEAVKNVINYYNIDINDILVIYDDMDFDVGKFKIKASGSSGGHNGIKSIIKYLGTEDFKRIRIGISKSSYDVVDYVLGKFSKEDMNKLQEVFNTINDVIDDFVSLPFEKLMSKYN